MLGHREKQQYNEHGGATKNERCPINNRHDLKLNGFQATTLALHFELGQSNREVTLTSYVNGPTGPECLILVALGGPTMFAYIGLMRALNRHVDRVFDPSRKEHNWGKRKLKRDE
jgi:hypothetical protein